MISSLPELSPTHTFDLAILSSHLLVGPSTSSNFRSNTHLAKFLALVHTLVEVLVGPILSYKTQPVLVLVCSDRAVRECTPFFEHLEASIWVRAVMASPANPVLVDHLVVSLEPHSSSSMEEVEERLLQAARDSPLATLAEDSPFATLAEVPSMAEAPC
jgi:hypothetical protein